MDFIVSRYAGELVCGAAWTNDTACESSSQVTGRRTSTELDFTRVYLYNVQSNTSRLQSAAHTD